MYSKRLHFVYRVDSTRAAVNEELEELLRNVASIWYRLLIPTEVRAQRNTWSAYAVIARRPLGSWSEPCGEVCPVRIRLTDRLEEVSVLKWGRVVPFDEADGPGDFDTGSTFGQIGYKWSLGTHCANALCPNSRCSALIEPHEPYYT